ITSSPVRPRCSPLTDADRPLRHNTAPAWRFEDVADLVLTSFGSSQLPRIALPYIKVVCLPGGGRMALLDQIHIIPAGARPGPVDLERKALCRRRRRIQLSARR